jgi:4-amino-4-deoxy-L-arabinose transferase-like glycosyltransferase
MPATAASVRDGIRIPRRFPAAWVGLWFAALMILTLGVRIANPTGWVGSDDASYHSAAEHLLTGQTIHRLHHQFARMAMIVPVAASIGLFGDNPAAVALPTLIASVVCVALVVVLGRLVWGWWEGLCAATLVSVLPYFRVLSTTAYPDVHACLWSTVAVLLAVMGRGERRAWQVAAYNVGCGLAIGLAASAKVFALTTCAGVAVIIWTHSQDERRQRMFALSAVVLGGLAWVVVDGLFYLWAADDFWFKFHALRSTQSSEALFEQQPGYFTLAWDRLTMLFDTGASGWGRIAVLFWPVLFLVLLLNPRGRGIAVWGLAAYLLVALMPIKWQNGPQPMPIFHGRHVLFACIPFALCLAWTIRRVAGLLLDAKWVHRAWPIACAAIVGLAYANPHELNGFKGRHTGWIGQGIEQITANTNFGDHHDILMPASLYLRFRILFPAELRTRLHIAVDDASPDWWRHAAVDIEAHRRPLAPPGQAYLLATPVQLRGEGELWDYGVRLPQDALDAWCCTPPRTTAGLLKDKTVGLIDGAHDDGEPLLVLLGCETTMTRDSQRTHHDTNVG